MANPYSRSCSRMRISVIAVSLLIPLFIAAMLLAATFLHELARALFRMRNQADAQFQKLAHAWHFPASSPSRGMKCPRKCTQRYRGHSGAVEARCREARQLIEVAHSLYVFAQGRAAIITAPEKQSQAEFHQQTITATLAAWLDHYECANTQHLRRP